MHVLEKNNDKIKIKKCKSSFYKFQFFRKINYFNIIFIITGLKNFTTIFISKLKLIYDVKKARCND